MNKNYGCNVLNSMPLPQKLIFIQPFRPRSEILLRLLRDKDSVLREKALHYFHDYYSHPIEASSELNIWLSGSLSSYKLVEMRTVLKAHNSKIVTRDSKKVNLLVVGEKTKLDMLPEKRNVSSTIELERLLKRLTTKEGEHHEVKEQEDELIELLLSCDELKIETAFQVLEKEGISLKLLPLMFGIFKVHREKHIRYHAKDLILKEKSSTAKKVMSFCEARNFINAKYTVGMEEMAKIGNFNIELFLYYLVLNQKHNLGKEYLASLNSDWTQKLIEEQELLNKKELTLYGQAGKKFLYATKIESFTVHAISSILWEMSWLKSLEIIELKERIILPKSTNFLELERLILESKEVVLMGILNIKELSLKKCKILRIDKSFKLPNITQIRVDACSFDLKVFEKFLQVEVLPTLKKIEIHNFIAYKIPKDFEVRLKEILPNVKIVVSR